jgi:UTP-glucose-1-phosphate uridylyltransferase
MKAIILAAGEGLRCRPLILIRSKVMLPVANKPILEYIIRALVQNDIKDIILVVGYKKERIMDYFGDGIAFGANINYVEQEVQIGTAHARRSLNFPIALEGALKLKEISYIHAEGYAAGELKHGPLALISKDTPVVALATRGLTYDKMLNNIKEVKARGSPVLAIASMDDTEITKYVDAVIRVQVTDELLYPVLSSVVVQLLAYYTADALGCPIDKPRNLAKSITVE